MGRIVAMILAFALFCACAVPPEEHTAQTTAPLPAKPESRPPDAEKALLAVAQGAQSLIVAAEEFCERLYRATDGALDIEVAQVSSPGGALRAGKAQLAFLSKKGELSFNELLSVTASPFLYGGYTNFTMMANAPELLKRLEASLRGEAGLVPLAAYYQGSAHLVTEFPTNAYQFFEGEIIAMAADSTVQDAFLRLGAESDVIHETDVQRLDALTAHTVTGAEASLSSILEYEWDPMGEYVVTLSYHNLTPVWFLAWADYFDSLTPKNRAAVLELCAWLSNRLEDDLLAEESRLTEALKDSGFELTDDIILVQNRVYGTLEPVSVQTPVQSRLARSLLDLMMSLRAYTDDDKL